MALAVRNQSITAGILDTADNQMNQATRLHQWVLRAIQLTVCLCGSMVELTDLNAGVVVGRWDFEDTLVDSSGNQYDFSAVGSPTFTLGVHGGRAIDFDGGSTPFSSPGSVDALDTFGSIGGSPSKPSFNGTGLSIMSWVNPDDLTFGAHILSQDRSVPSAKSYGYSLGIASDGRLALGLRDELDHRLSVFSIAKISLNTWTHVAATWDGSLTGGLNLYINGAQVATTLSTNGSFSGLQGPDISIRAGATHGDSGNTIYGFDGQLDNLSLWSGALTANEVAAEFNSGATMVPEPTSLAIFLGVCTVPLLSRRRIQN